MEGAQPRRDAGADAPIQAAREARGASEVRWRVVESRRRRRRLRTLGWALLIGGVAAGVEAVVAQLG